MCQKVLFNITLMVVVVLAKTTMRAKKGASEECLTTDGDSGPGKKCVFPFTFHQKTFSECTTYGAQDGLSWCSTEVDDRGWHKAGTWGHCSQKCPGYKKGKLECKTLDGRDCILPTVKDYMKYYGCIREDKYSQYKCYVNVNETTEEKELAVCSPDCEKADDLLSETELTIKEILLELSNDGVAHTAIPNDEPLCTSFLQEKYEEEVSGGPDTFLEVLNTTCSYLCTLSICAKGFTSQQIQHRTNKNVINRAHQEAGGYFVIGHDEIKSDCRIRCATDQMIRDANLDTFDVES